MTVPANRNGGCLPATGWPSGYQDSVYTEADLLDLGYSMGIARRKRLVCTALAMLPAVLSLAALVGPVVARAATHPRGPRHPSYFCGVDVCPGGSADRGSISSRQGSTFTHLSLSVSSEPLSFHVGKGVVNVLAFDVDRDGDTDLVALRKDLRVRVWLNNGHGKFVRRNRPGLSISFGSKLLTRDSQQVGAFCWSSSYDDGASLVGCARTSAIAADSSETRGLESSERPTTDPFLALIHPRGPPPRFA